jgi:hypothetical protein
MSPGPSYTVHCGVAAELVARLKLFAAVGRSVTSVEVGVIRVTSDVSSRRDNRVAGLNSYTDVYPGGQGSGYHQNSNDESGFQNPPLLMLLLHRRSTSEKVHAACEPARPHASTCQAEKQ